MKFGIAGTGNAAWHFSKMLQQSGHDIVEVFSRNGATLSTAPHAKYFSNPALFSSSCDIVFIAVSDDAIAEISSAINDQLCVVHVSGNTRINALLQTKSGVVWPLQSLVRNKEMDYSAIPFLIEASDTETENNLMNLFRSISPHVVQANSESRAKVHLAAVFANNFVNYLYSIANDILTKEHLSFDLLLPMLEGQLEKLRSMTPDQAQTGPARRADMKTIESHLDLMKSDAEKKTIYIELTNRLLQHFHGKKL